MQLKGLIRRVWWKTVLPAVWETQGTAAPVTLRNWLLQKVVGINRQAYWPMHHSSVASSVENIRIGIGTAPGLSPGCYIQGAGQVFIGDYTLVAPNVGIISANHDPYDYRKHQKKIVIIGRYCWLGMNSIILPGVALGDHTIVAAGAVVTKSFEHGYCVLAGNPARLVKRLDPESCIEHHNQYEYYGYIKKPDFERFRKNRLNV